MLDIERAVLCLFELMGLFLDVHTLITDSVVFLIMTVDACHWIKCWHVGWHSNNLMVFLNYSSDVATLFLNNQANVAC